MKMKWPVLTAISLVCTALISCGEQIVKADIRPEYTWGENIPLYYHLSGKFDVVVDAAIVRYEGSMEISAELELRNIPPKNSAVYGKGILMLMRDPKVNGGDSKVNASLIGYINKLREWFSLIYITPQGKVNVLYAGKPHIVLNTIAQTVIPELTSMDALWDKYTFKTNYPADVAGNNTLNTFQKEMEIIGYDDQNIEIKTHIEFTTYDEMQYLKSVEPIKMGVAAMDFIDLFDYKKGQWVEKKGTVDARYNMPVSQGILSVIVSVQVIGTFEVVMTNKGAL